MNEAGIVTLVLGGARSGKSEVAEDLAAGLAGTDPRPVTYVATGAIVTIAPEEPDPDWEARVAAHRARRPDHWETLEVHQSEELAPALRDLVGPALVDSIGTWAVGLAGFGDEAPGAIDGLCAVLTERRSSGHLTVLVSEEVGLGVHPPTADGNRFRDAVGSINRRLADIADDVLLVVAGRVLPLVRPDELGCARAAPQT